MRSKKPPFEITTIILQQLIRVSELLGRLHSAPALINDARLQRRCQLKSVYADLALEGRNISLAQVQALAEGQPTTLSAEDRAAVKNALHLYDMLNTLNPCRQDDLLRAHAALTGCDDGFRTALKTTVYDDGSYTRAMEVPDYIPEEIAALLRWLQRNNAPALIKACVCHFELEMIQPFDKQLRHLCRLWQKLLLWQWDPIFAWLPVEVRLLADKEYYENAIYLSESEENSTVFIQYMLTAIGDTLEAVLCDKGVLQ